jgi:hypothetical protein
MQANPRRALSVIVCSRLICGLALLVPAGQRDEWRQEWLAEIWHRWQFLLHAGIWDWLEACRLLWNCTGAFADAAWLFTSHHPVQNRIRECVRSPWTCLGLWGTALLALALLTSGLPATRALFQFSRQVGPGTLLYIWIHPGAGGGDKGVPSDVAPAWAQRSALLDSVAAFTTSYEPASSGINRRRPLVVHTDPNLFRVLRISPALGAFPAKTGVVLTADLWRSMFHRNPRIIGLTVRVKGDSYPVAAVLPGSFHFLSRQPALYVVTPFLAIGPTMVVARVKPGVSTVRLNRELTRIAEDSCYYFFQSELRYSSIADAVGTPLSVFGVAALVCGLLALAASRLRFQRLRVAFKPGSRTAMARRSGFFLAKTTLSLAFVFIAGLEWLRPETALLFGSKDPASGPFLLWLYILGAMGVFFWSVADQRARCRVCLRLLCFPVRIGCPGCLLLDWAGTELLCTEGHGVLHVPHMAASWEEESDHWIALDDSWKELFAGTK